MYLWPRRSGLRATTSSWIFLFHGETMTAQIERSEFHARSLIAVLGRLATGRDTHVPANSVRRNGEVQSGEKSDRLPSTPTSFRVRARATAKAVPHARYERVLRSRRPPVEEVSSCTNPAAAGWRSISRAVAIPRLLYYLLGATFFVATKQASLASPGQSLCTTLDDDRVSRSLFNQALE